MSDIEVRPAISSDEVAVLALLEELFEPPGAFPPGYTRERGREGFRSALSEDNADVLLAVDGDRIVGLASVYADIQSIRFGKRCWLQDLVTRKTDRSRGVGRALLSAAGAWAQARGCNHLELSSGLGRLDAHRFYEREGMAKASYTFTQRLGE
jgi:GNAT superfamily N-acetyltransferase